MSERRVALVTGAARRIGRACRVELARCGFEVISVVREANGISDKIGGRVAAVDLSDAAAVDRFIASVDRCDLLVNAASVYEPDDTPGGSPSLIAKLTAVNVDAPRRLTLGLADRLRATRGCVVNFIDLMADHPWPKYSAYCASKAALAGVTRSHARLLAPHVRVLGIAPGMIGPIKPGTGDDADAYLKRVPLARAGTFDEAATLVRFLATEATYLTGEIIRLDGGRHLT